ncbi:MAG: hypothetical protein KGL39_44670, partial [Patescibacteria group bacterium]|nr:hypothetical protein [Patescibacteria group bacterium]
IPGASVIHRRFAALRAARKLEFERSQKFMTALECPRTILPCQDTATDAKINSTPSRDAAKDGLMRQLAEIGTHLKRDSNLQP